MIVTSRAGRGAERRPAAGVGQRHREGLVRLVAAVVEDRHRERLGRLVRPERQRAARGEVVAAGGRRARGRLVVHRDPARGADPLDGDGRHTGPLGHRVRGRPQADHAGHVVVEDRQRGREPGPEQRRRARVGQREEQRLRRLCERVVEDGDREGRGADVGGEGEHPAHRGVVGPGRRAARRGRVADRHRPRGRPRAHDADGRGDHRLGHRVLHRPELQPLLGVQDRRRRRRRGAQRQPQRVLEHDPERLVALADGRVGERLDLDLLRRLPGAERHRARGRGVVRAGAPGGPVLRRPSPR